MHFLQKNASNIFGIFVGKQEKNKRLSVPCFLNPPLFLGITFGFLVDCIWISCGFGQIIADYFSVLQQ
jgi:hypothetical protein